MKSILQLELDEPIKIQLLFEHSPFYSKLLKQHEVKLIDDREDQLFFVLRGTISAEDAMRTIEIFDFDKNYLNKKIIFFENTSGNDWNVVEKNKTDYELKITTSFTTSETLQDTSAYNWLQSKEIQGILEKNKWFSAVKFNQPLEQCFENNKKHEFHVRTLFCNYLSENLPTNDSLATLDLDDLILKNFDTGVNKLKFKEGDKFDFKYLFPVDESDLSKVKTFYCDGEAGQEKMISKVVKILDKYYEDHEREKNIQGKVIQVKDLETFLIVEKAIDQIIETKSRFGDDCQFPDEDYEKIKNFSIKYSKNKNGNLFEPVGDFVLAVEGFFQNLLGNFSDNASKIVSPKEGAEILKSDDQKREEADKKPSNFLEGIIDAIAVCCGSRKEKGGGR